MKKRLSQSTAVVPTAVSDASRFRIKRDVSARRAHDGSRDDCGTTRFRLIFTFVIFGAIIFCLPFFEKVQAEKTDAKVKTEQEPAVENALYTRTEFFGAPAFVPFPTEKARDNLADILQKYPNDAEIYRKLAELDEKLEKFDSAESELQKFAELQKNDLHALEILGDFYERRAEFEKEAAILEKLLTISPEAERAAMFSRLIEFAQIHELEQYLKPEFYQKIAAENSAIFPLVEQLIDKLTKEKNYAEALKILRGYKDKFPERRNLILKKEIEILLSMKNKAEAEQVYQAAFDPFWSDTEMENYYSFLKDQDRFRAFGSELKAKFKRDSADFDTAARLIYFRKNDGVYDNDSSTTVILQVEKARNEKNITWKPEELVTAARILLADGESDLAARFLYTLHLQNALAPKSELRAKILYQLFELLSDSDEQRISLTKGDLRFYEDVGKSDLHPGITSGILSLIFSDTAPQKELDNKETTATTFFNRAAAYRIFLAYKEEYPTSPELAQMYLDIVRLYTATKQSDIAAKTLAEFEQRYEKSSDYPQVALRLADAFASTDQPEKEREIYRRILDYLGKQSKSLTPKIEIKEFETDSDDSYIPPPAENDKPQISNQGIEIPGEKKKDDYYYYDDNRNSLRDYLGKKDDAITYSGILKRLVESLSKDKQTEKILALYSGEIAKYPDEQWLYEQRLEWLEQANLVDEQLKVYKSAIDRFKTTNWQDKLARWFLRREKNQEFAEFSQDLIGNLNDADTQNYLNQFVDQKISGSDLDEQLYLKLYVAAHERFPHNVNFVNGLLNFYKAHKREDDWRELSAEYYFESKSVRDIYIKNLAEKDELRNYLNKAREKCCADENSPENLPYALFRADAAAHLANFEEAVDVYTKLNELYPHTLEFQERLLNFTRSFGQRNRGSLAQAANIAHAQAEFTPSSAEFRTRSGEIQAELGNYNIARNEWEKLIATAPGEPEIYLETATVYWDYFQYDDALRTIKNLREKMNDDTLYAFQTGAILESQHKLPAAISEYVKALDSAEDENYSQTSRSKNRLAQIAEKTPDNLRLINTAFENERGKRQDDSNLVLAYADFLQRDEQMSQVKTVLKLEITHSQDKDFLESARGFFSENDDKNGEQTALRRLAETSKSPRGAISYRLQLADSLLDENRRDEAETVVSELLKKFPTNYGVLSESADIYWRINARDEAIHVLQTGVNQGKGKFQYIFSRKLAAKLVLQNRLAEAENILLELHNEDAGDTDVFRELINIYVVQNKPDSLKKVFGETLEALKNQDIERRELNAQVADFRVQMIDAFTRLKDYRAAVGQYIEIINREPDDEENIENAINYVKRYGGGDVLLAYYQKTADAAYKNYRWNVVLARIYEADHDLDDAVQNYKKAIDNQPEMPELYLAVVDIETRRRNYDAALENINKVLELTNDDTAYIKRKIKILSEAGRAAEAEAERAKLPVEEKPQQQTVSEQFQTAQNLQSVEKSKAAAAYRQAFDELLKKPDAHYLTAADVSGYVQTLQTEENLAAINEKLWNLRDKFIVEADGNNVINAAKARNQQQTLDGAMPDAIGNAAKNLATSDENAALQKDLSRRIDEVFQKTDSHSTLSLLQNMAYRAGFGALTEKILIARKDNDFVYGEPESYHNRLRDLISFYSERGMFQRALEVLGAEQQRDKHAADFDYSRGIAENARLVGDNEKELTALRENYQAASGKIIVEPNDLTARYLEFLYRNDRAELAGLTKKYSPYQLQLINFLLSKGERDAAHEAIQNTELPRSWKLARNAETSLALREYSGKDECYFCDALRLAPIGEFIAQRPDKANELVGDAWFRLVGEYGEWLYFTPNEDGKNDAKNFLPAMIENRPNSADEQLKLGVFYLKQKDTKNALESLQMAAEINPSDKNIKANLGAALFQTGDEKKAREIWAQIIAGENVSVEDGELYLQTLSEYNLQAEARENLLLMLVKNLKENDSGKENYYDSKKQKLPENLKIFIRQLSDSFDAESAETAYFQKLAVAVPKSVLLPGMLLDENLIAEKFRAPFYEILIARTGAASGSDYDYEAVLQKTYGTEEAEEIFDLENNFKVTQPEGEHIVWEKEYLNYLLKIGKNNKARKLISDIKSELNRRYPRPEWLRLAALKLQMRQGNLAKTLDDAKRFIGIEIKSDVSSVKPPSVERLNDVLQILRDEKACPAVVPTAVVSASRAHVLNPFSDLEAGRVRDGSRDDCRTLLQAFYWRQLALEQYETANFTGLAQIFFERNDAENALQILQLLNEAADENTKPEAFGKLAALPNIKLFAVDSAKVKEAKTVDTLNQNDALRLSAETCVNAGRIDEAIAFRAKLLEIAPDDAKNRLELARLYARNNNQPETVKLLAEIINNQNTDVNSRWQAVWLARAIVDNKVDLLNAAVSADGALRNALEILAKNQIEIKVENASLQFWFFVGSVARSYRQNDFAITAFQNALIADDEANNPFDEENAAQQLMRLYVAKNQPNAAFRLADENNATKSDELLNMLSEAAEKAGDFGRAIDYEKAKLKEVDEEKIARLQNLNEEKIRKVTEFTVKM